MPTRYLKPGIRDSEAIDSLTPDAEVLFYRLLVTVDDFGRYDGRPAMIKAACYPIKDKHTTKDVKSWVTELSNNGLVVVYESENKPFIQLLKWDNKPRASSSKYPSFADNCIQLYTDVCIPRTCVPLTETKTVTKTSHSKAASDSFIKFWEIWPYKKAKVDAEKAWKKLGIDDQRLAYGGVKSFWSGQKVDFYINPATYLNGRRWEDERDSSNSSSSLDFAGAI